MRKGFGFTGEGGIADFSRLIGGFRLTPLAMHENKCSTILCILNNQVRLSRLEVIFWEFMIFPNNV